MPTTDHDTHSAPETDQAEAASLIVHAKVKATLRALDLQVGAGTLEALNNMMLWYLKQAALRAKANGRKTVRPHDIIVMEAYR